MSDIKSPKAGWTAENAVLCKSPRQESRKGIMYGFFAYLIWGSFPVFFKLLPDATPLEIVSHRIFWSAIFLLILVLLRRQVGKIRQTLSDRKVLFTLCGSTLLIATNWLTFLFAIQRGEVLQSSLGYFITPLLSVLLGFAFLGERLGGWQKLSVLFAFSGVSYLVFEFGQVPWIALILATSFGFYGLLRKVAQIDALIGLTVETLLLAPIAGVYLLYLSSSGQSVFLNGSTHYNVLLPLAGVITAIPLLFFIASARRLQLATIGFLQYITPSLHFVLAVVVFAEPFSGKQFFSFLLIWVGLAVYSLDAIWKHRQDRVLLSREVC
ncbi:MAG: EamA family transporter RarD [Desulfuromusa sp.]|jgi:chloramphenicol-sensitive protein RarD|nr:EamA family transporter RarD [Desulfuromusa sp.]